MSAPLRGPGGGSSRVRPTPTSSGTRGRGAGRGSTSSHTRGRGGLGRGTPSTSNPRAEGLLQGLQNGSWNKRGESSSARAGRGRSFTPRGPSRSTRGRGAMLPQDSAPSVHPPSSTPRANPTQKDFMTEMSTKFQYLKQRREAERAKAIRDGFLADPEKKTSLEKAITPVGTCTEMCPEFERVERIVQNMVEKLEKVSNEATGRDMPVEERMVKRFRRSAAGNDEQLPSDIRTPTTLQATLDYLITHVVGGGEQLASVHKFVWDRTRAIRNDFSIQQVSKDEDVRIAIDCFEKVARFHILSLHQLSNPDNLAGEGFDAHQELEQLNNTLLSLMYYYDDNREKQRFPNEAEFRAYYIMFELQTSHPDLDDRMQSWPTPLLNSKRVQTAFRLHAAATNTLFDQGPLKPAAPFSIAQGNSGAFWKLLKSKAVSYLMSCVAEIYFGQVRYLTLQNLWESHKGPLGQQSRNQEWTLSELTDALAFDNDEETLEFCQGYGLTFKTSDDGVYHLVFQSFLLDQSFTPRKQLFSHSIVEAKRYRRSLVAVINGIGVARAIREGLVEGDTHEDGAQPNATQDDSGEGLFFPENSVAPTVSGENKPASIFNPETPIFIPSAKTQTQPAWPSSTTSFGKPSAITQFTPPTNTPSAPTSTAPIGSSLPSFFPAGSESSSTAFGIGSNPSFVNPFASKPQSSAPSSPFTTPAPAPTKFPDFQFGHPSTNVSPPTSTIPPFSFGKPSTTPSIFGQPSTLPQGNDQEQSSTSEKPGDAPTFSSNLPGSSMTWNLPANAFQEKNNTFPPSETQENPPSVSPWPVQDSQQQKNNEIVQERPSFAQHPPLTSVPQVRPESVKDAKSPLLPPSPLPPFRFEVSGASAKSSSPTLPPNTGTGFNWERPPATSSPRNADGNTTQVPITDVFAPKPLPSFNSISQPPPTSSTTVNTSQTPFVWNVPAPSVEDESTSPASNVPQTSPLAPSQFPAPHVPPKVRKPVQPKTKLPKTKELKAISPNDPTPRAHSPLRERPVIFGDRANAFRQAAALAVNPPSPKTTVLPKDRNNAAETVARLAMMQPAGLMHEYLQFTLPDLLKPVMQQYEREKPILAAKAARRQILAKKYFKRWKTNIYRHVKNRQARERRRRISAFNEDRQRRMRSDTELEAILQAKKESERIKAEMLARSTNESKDNVPGGVQQAAGQKRKSIQIDRAEDFVNAHAPRKIHKGHNRSRTMGHTEELLDSSRPAFRQVSANTSPAQPRSSVYSGRSILHEPETSKDFRRSLSGRKDTTRTDYFRLKALGIDPDTPLVPDTKWSLERKRQREEESANGTTKDVAMTLSLTERPHLSHSSPLGSTPVAPSGPNQLFAPLNTNEHTNPSSVANEVDDDDELLRKAREARETFSEGAEWFKMQAVNLEKEEQEEMRRSTSHASTRSSPHPSSGGLARVNGYEYLPGPEVPGRSLSRTEQRIRRTGAHGLATKPIGASGTYLAVAMSRDTAAKLLQNRPEVLSATKKTKKGKKRTGERDNRYIPEQSENDSEELEDHVDANGLEAYTELQSQSVADVNHTGRNTKKGKRKTSDRDGRYVPQQSDEDSEEFEGDPESSGLERHPEPRTNGKQRAVDGSRHWPKPYEESSGQYDEAQKEDDVQESLEQLQYIEYDEFEGGDTDELYEDVDDEEEQYDDDEEEREEVDEGAGEDEENDEVGSLTYQQGQKGQGRPVSGYWLRSSVTPERGLTPTAGGQMMSRASSGMGTGTGASVDDALVLDSD